MIDPVRAFLEGASLETPVMPASSRYHGLGTDVITTVDGRTIRYLKRRLLPPVERFALLQEHALVAGDRVDNLAYRYFADAQQYWRLCDANGVMRPDELSCLTGASGSENLGRLVRITLPEGIAGPSHD